MPILITGGTGFIGSHLARRLAALGNEVVAFGRESGPAVESANANRLTSQGIEVVLGSITDRERLRRLAGGCRLIIHLAAAQHEMHISDDEFFRVNVQGTECLLEAAADAGVERFVYGSTIGVYGSGAGRVMDESTPTAPDDIYGETKSEAEKVVRSFADRMETVIVRISETYGPGDRRLLKLFRGIRKGLFLLPGGGPNLHHPVFIEDLVEGIRLAATHPSAVGHTFVLAGKDSLTTRQMAEAIADAVGKPLRRFHPPLAIFLATAAVLEAVLRPFGIPPPLHRRRMAFFWKNQHFSIERAQRILGYDPQIEFQEGARLTALDYQREGLLQ